MLLWREKQHLVRFKPTNLGSQQIKIPLNITDDCLSNLLHITESYPADNASCRIMTRNYLTVAFIKT